MKYPQFRFTTAAIAATALALGAATAGATTYYWKPGATQGLWTTLSNWSTEAVDGADADALPGSGDSLWGNGDYNFDLDGGTYSLAGWPVPGDWNNHFLTIANGTLAFTDDVSTHSGQINVDADGVLNLPAGSSFVPGLYSSSGLTINVNNGGTMSVGGSVRLYNGSFAVASGGNLTFAPSSLRFGAESHSYALTFSNAGTLSLPNGFSFNRWDTASVDAGSTYTFTSSGTLNLGGPIANAPDSSSSKAGLFNVVLSGGMVNATGNVTFDVTSVSVQNAVTVNVDSGKTIDLSPATFAAGSSITKTGAGAVILPTSAPTATISAGSLAINAATYDLSDVTFASGATVNLATLGARIDSFDSSLTSDATFTADLSGASAGTVILFSTDASLLAKVASDLSGNTLPEGCSLVPANGSLSIERASSASFTTTGDLLNGTCWGGTLPADGSDVAIDGAGVVATFSSGTIPAWNSIEVKNGATLRIEADADLPAIALNKNAKLEIASGTSFVTNGLNCVALVSQLPVLEVATNATLSVASAMKFKNVDFRLYGTITKASDSDASPVFGYADNGETSYFAFTADGGVFDFHSNQNVANGSVSFVCPASGGTVMPVGTITLRNASRNVTGWADFGNWEFGLNNPTSIGFAVLADGTDIDCSACFYAAGAAHLTLVNGASIRRNAHCGGHYFSQAIRDAATVTIGEGCYLDFTTGDGLFGVDSQVAVDAVTVRDGGIYNVTYNAGGWLTGVFVSDDGILGVGKLYSSSSSTRTPRTDLLQGFGTARLDGDLSIASVNVGLLGNTDWDRHTTMANIPFSGTGDVVITNGVPTYPFTVTMQNGANTATGSIKVAKATGDAETALYFADGANWAGSVVAGNVALTNLTGAAAATTTFGSLNLAEDFPVRVWLDNGSIATNDMINVGEYVANGGKLLPTLVDGGDFPGGAKLTIGLIGKGNTLPAGTLPRKWVASTADAGDGSHDILSIKFGAGTQITLR